MHNWKYFIRKKYNIYTISETWLNSDISNVILCIQGYNFIRIDRDAERGGGIGIYIKNNIKYKVIPIRGNIEQLCVSFSLYKKTFALRVLYKSPDFNCINFLSNIESTVQNELLLYVYLVALGDFNINQLKIRQPSNKSL